MSFRVARADATVVVMVRRAHLLLLAFVALVAVAAAGCGGTSVAVPELTSFQTAATKSSAAQSARFEMTVAVSLPGTDKSLTFSASGAFDNAAKRSEAEVDMSALADMFSSFGAALGASGSTDTGNTSDWKLHVIQDGQTAYVQFPPLTRQLPAGKTWVMGNATDLSGSSGAMGQFGSVAGASPKDAFGMLKAVSGSIEAVGTDTLHGVETSHYRATLDLAKVEQLLPAARRDALGSLDQSAAQAGLSEIPFDIWIDADNQVRKLTMDIDAKQPGTDKSVKASLSLEVYDYGTPVEIELPPADQVVDASTLKQS